MDPLELETRDYLNRQLYNALQRAAAAEHRVVELKAEKRKLHDRRRQFVWVNLELQDINDGLKAENARLQELVKTFMAADLARADVDRD